MEPFLAAQVIKKKETKAILTAMMSKKHIWAINLSQWQTVFNSFNLTGSDT